MFGAGHLASVPKSASISFENEVRDAGIRFGQRGLLRQEHDTEVLRARLLAESRSVHDHDVLLADQLLHEYFVAFRNVDFGVGIKSPARRDATQARCGLAPFLGE